MTREEENKIYKEGLEIAAELIFYKNNCNIIKEEITSIAAANFLLNFWNYDEKICSKRHYISKIIDNLLIDNLRKKKTKKYLKTIELDFDAEEKNNIEEKIDYLILKNKVQQILKENFDEKQNKLFGQYFFDEENEFDLSSSKNKSLIFRAKKILKQKLYNK